MFFEKFTTEQKIEKLKYFKEHYISILEQYDSMTWWQKYKFRRLLIKCLPVYTPLEVSHCWRTHNWKVEIEYNKKLNVYTGKVMFDGIKEICVTSHFFVFTYYLEKGVIEAMNVKVFDINDFKNKKGEY